MTNKIPQEIEEKILKEVLFRWDLPKTSINKTFNYNLKNGVKEAIQKGFKAGQKQSEDAFKEMIEEFDFKIHEAIVNNETYEPVDEVEEKEIGDRILTLKWVKKELKELLSQLNSKEKKQDENK